MTLRFLVKWTAVAVTIAMPLMVANMVSAYVNNGSAMVRVSLAEIEMIRLAQLSGDVRSLPPAAGSILLARHGLDSTAALQKKLDLARSTVTQIETEVQASAMQMWRSTVVGFVCVSISSWLAISMANVLPRRRASSPAPAA